MRLLIQLFLLLILAGAAEAHLGNENNTEVRVYADRMQVVVRTSIPFAWRMIGDRAPAMADEAGKAIARPLLIEAAPRLFEIMSGGKLMTPTKLDCVFEVENDVAFVLTFDRPVEWPVVLKATFFESLTNLDSGTVRVFDFTASRFNSDLKPLAEGVIHQGNPALSFSLVAVAPALAVEPATVAIQIAPSGPTQSPRAVMFLILLLAIGALTLLWKFRSRLCKR